MPIFIHGLESPSTTEFTEHPDFRQICTFFLGWVFITSVSCLLSSSLVQGLLWKVQTAMVPSTPADERNSRFDVESVHFEKTPSLMTKSTDVILKGDSPSLFFILSLCFTFASLAHFASLLAFTPNGGETACAFVVAWGGMSAQSARLVGLLILLAHLKRLGITRWERISFIIWLVVGLGLAFATNAISIGIVEPVRALKIDLCYRKHFLPTSLASSFVFLGIEAYTIGRLIFLTSPPFLSVKHQFGALKDNRVKQALSLLVLDVLTAVPSAIFTNLIADFVPFSIGAVLVLFAFNQPSVVPPQNLSIHTIPPSISSASQRSVTPPIQPARWTYQSRSPEIPSRISFVDHPYSARSLANPTPENREWPRTARSSRTIDTVSAQSIRNAIIQAATRGPTPSAARVATPELVHLASPAPQSSVADVGDSPWFSGPSAARHILPSQDEYAAALDASVKPLPLGLPIRPQLKVATTTFRQAESVSDHQDAETFSAPTESVYYGSDIVRGYSNPSSKDATRTPNDPTRSNRNSDPSSFISSVVSVQRQSYVTTIHGQDELSLSPVDEDASTTYSGPSRRRSRKNRPDEASFRAMGYSSPIVSPLSASPTVWAARQPKLPPFPLPANRRQSVGTGRLLGPRPPPFVITPLDLAKGKPRLRSTDA